MVLVPVLLIVCRSREGAWIEISKALQDAQKTFGRSREGAWIEITPGALLKVNPGSLPRGSVD